MVKNIIKFSLNNKLFILVLAILVSIGGVYTAANMDTDVFPDLTAPTVVVMTEARGMAPEEVERLISFPIETMVNGSTGIRRVRSSSAQGFSLVWVEFDWDMDIYNARQIVSEKLQMVSDRMPNGVSKPTLMPQSSIMGEIYILALSSDSISNMELRSLADWNIRNRLLAIEGVAQVSTYSEEKKQYQVNIDPHKMAYYDVGIGELLEILSEGNKNVSGSFIEAHGNRYVIRGMARTSDVKKLGNRIVKTTNGKPICLNHVAEVTIASAPTIGGASYETLDAVVMLVTKQPKTNTLDLTEKIDATLDDIQANLPSHITIHRDIFKQASFIKSAVGNVGDALFEGGIFVAIILFIFLMNFRVTIISLISIPVSLLITVITLKLMGLGINTMVLGGMAIAIGSLVDDAIVDLENVYKRLRENAQKPEKEQQSQIKVIYNASLEIRSSIVNATLIIMAAFIPLFFLSGMEGRMLKPLGFTYVISLFASLVVAMTLTNVLEVYLLTNKRLLKKHANGSFVERKLIQFYRTILEKAMHLKKVILISVAFIFLVSMIILGQFGRSFLPEFNEGSFTIVVTTLPDISYPEAKRTMREVERVLMSIQEIGSVEGRLGRAELAEHSAGLNTMEFDMPYQLGDKNKETFLNEVRSRLNTIPGIVYELGQPLTHRINHMMSGTRAVIAIKLFGPEVEKLHVLGEEIKKSISDVEGAVDIAVEQQVNVSQIKIIPKEHNLNSYGISMNEFNNFIETGFGGNIVASVFEKERMFDLQVRFKKSFRNNMEQIKNARIFTASGKSVPLRYVAEVKSSSGPNVINRENVRRKLVVSANVAERDVHSVVLDIQSKIASKVNIPDGYFIEYGGQFKSEEKASRTLWIASIFALLIIFLLLYQEFRNTTTTAIILLNLPLALIGGVMAIWMTFGELNIPAIIGFITLFGIATRNGILLVSRYNTLKEKGLDYYDIIIKGSSDRLIPILMTALTAALALIPMALASDAAGNEIQSPMAIVILGGLLSSTLLNLFVLPIIFMIREKRMDR
ncbi:efflux RND transporter permease subunit [Labilibacter marinus]|uniref:efflux RND transporter permease subunit n=1 Tax=Labilibacter marinus TaxID=1477105 RepID=UPI00094F83BB|nr:efflux RND transporter permease subunit [Labilibacter marinus]